MTPKSISALDFRKHFGEITDEVYAAKQTYIVSKNGRPIMVMMAVETYENLNSKNQKMEAHPSPMPAPVQAPVSVPMAPMPSHADDAFIENYSQERIQEFLKENRLWS